MILSSRYCGWITVLIHERRIVAGTPVQGMCRQPWQSGFVLGLFESETWVWEIPLTLLKPRSLLRLGTNCAANASRDGRRQYDDGLSNNYIYENFALQRCVVCYAMVINISQENTIVQRHFHSSQLLQSFDVHGVDAQTPITSNVWYVKMYRWVYKSSDIILTQSQIWSVMNIFYWSINKEYGRTKQDGCSVIGYLGIGK